ncbi:MAG: hypothetical protein EOP09_20015 [Proteobacteria bacterium]|nr:MAG: hypothetical protein EOP09_20015 [Pseudomonadota bacterium]
MSPSLLLANSVGQPCSVQISNSESRAETLIQVNQSGQNPIEFNVMPDMTFAKMGSRQEAGRSELDLHAENTFYFLMLRAFVHPRFGSVIDVTIHGGDRPAMCTVRTNP